MFWSVLVASATAGSPVPVTCEAVFIGPTETCSMEGEWAASGTAASESAASRRARARLLEATGLALTARESQAEGTIAMVVAAEQRLTCPEAVEELRMSCFPSLELTQTQTCFADLVVDECPVVPVVILEGVGFKVMEKSRQQLCRDLDAALSTSRLTTAEQLSCRSRCLLESRVRCR